MRRRRFQKGSLQLRKHADRRVWVILYYDEKRERRYHTLGWASEMTKGTADEKRQEFMREINGGGRTTGATGRPPWRSFSNKSTCPSTAGSGRNRPLERRRIASGITSERSWALNAWNTSRWRRSSSSWSRRRHPACHSALWITSGGTSLQCSRWPFLKRSSQ